MAKKPALMRFLIIAKNDKVHAKLCQMIKDRQVERMYIAIVHNKPKSDFVLSLASAVYLPCLVKDVLQSSGVVSTLIYMN